MYVAVLKKKKKVKLETKQNFGGLKQKIYNNAKLKIGFPHKLHSHGNSKDAYSATAEYLIFVRIHFVHVKNL